MSNFDLNRDPGDLQMAMTAALTPSSQRSAARRDARRAAKDKVRQAKYTPQTQPRDNNGKYRRVLYRLKQDLGKNATGELAKEIEEAEAAGAVGNYEEMRRAGGNVVKLLEAVKDGQFEAGLTENLRKGAADLGRTLAYLPLPQGNPNAKVRFSDLPPAASKLVTDMLQRVKDKLPADEAKKWIETLESFKSGVMTMSSDQMSAELNKLLRVLA